MSFNPAALLFSALSAMTPTPNGEPTPRPMSEGAKRRSEREWQEKEIRRCKRSFLYFCARYLWIVTKKSGLIRFALNPAQKLILRAVEEHSWVAILKARQLGSSTFLAAYYFWRTLFRPRHRCLVVAHVRTTAETIFDIYRTYYDNLPDWMRDFFRLDTANKGEMRFAKPHGGYIRVTTARSPEAKGSTYQSIHATEVSEYPDLVETAGDIFNTASADAVVVLETTANGINEFYDLWRSGQSEASGGGVTWKRLFLSWLLDPEYTGALKADELDEWETKYLREHPEVGLGRMGWVRQTLRKNCVGNEAKFFSHYPSNPEEAFLTSGRPFFYYSFKDVKLPGEHETPLPDFIEYEPPKPWRTYTMGVDTATGDAGDDADRSAFVVLDVTERTKPRTVATFAGRIGVIAYAIEVERVARVYNAMAVVEANSVGVTVCEYLLEVAYPWLYMRTVHDKTTDRFEERCGYSTQGASRWLMLNAMAQLLITGALDVVCPRIKDECNSFVHGPRGRPEAAAGKHDDLVFATALAIQGMDQVVDLQRTANAEKKPRGVREILEWEAATGEIYDPRDWKDTDEEAEARIPKSGLLSLLAAKGRGGGQAIPTRLNEAARRIVEGGTVRQLTHAS